MSAGECAAVGRPGARRSVRAASCRSCRGATPPVRSHEPGERPWGNPRARPRPWERKLLAPVQGAIGGPAVMGVREMSPLALDLLPRV